MKKLLGLLLFVCFVAFLISSCSSPKPEKTIENLKAAATGESNASAKYAAFAQKAQEEGYDTIAKMFFATSKAESIHAANHLSVLKKLGVEFTPKVEEVNALTTAENLKAALEGETYEFSTMYPEFISIAEKENAKDAVTSFNWANDTEKKHKEFYQKALDTITNSTKETGLSFVWAVCPKCGNTFSDAAIEEKCSFCMTPKEKYLSF